MSRVTELLAYKRPLVMGILNVTPDSFSDGGRFVAKQDAIAQAQKMIAEGADIIDVGGESTRPGASGVSDDEEISRILPVVRGLRQISEVAISIDTSKAAVMSACLDHDIDLINDVRALQEPGTAEILAASGLMVCLMHMKGEPRSMQSDPVYDDLFGEIADFFRQRIAACESAGIGSDRLILDIGFGFGKTPGHNLALINQLHRFGCFDLPLLVGLSRKSTIGQVVEDRLLGSLAGALMAVGNGAKIVRVHDVGQTKTVLQMQQAILMEKVRGSGEGW